MSKSSETRKQRRKAAKIVRMIEEKLRRDINARFEEIMREPSSPMASKLGEELING